MCIQNMIGTNAYTSINLSPLKSFRCSPVNTYPIWLHTIRVLPIMVPMFVCECPKIQASIRLSAI